MKPITKNHKPCAECPYRKDAVPGYFGGNDPLTYALPILVDEPLPCHCTQGTEQETVCTGLVAARVNSAKRSRADQVLAQSESVINQESRDVSFGMPHDFCKHHKISIEDVRNRLYTTGPEDL